MVATMEVGTGGGSRGTFVSYRLTSFDTSTTGFLVQYIVVCYLLKPFFCVNFVRLERFSFSEQLPSN